MRADAQEEKHLQRCEVPPLVEGELQAGSRSVAGRGSRLWCCERC